jgi:glycosyltransferase involved in cell wall biosynthesis
VNIVQVVENLEVGGLERMAVDLAIAQARAGHSVSFCCLHEKGPLADVLENAGLSVFACRKPPGLSLSAVRMLARQFRTARAEVVHGHNPGVHHYAAVAARLAGAPVCVNTRHSALTSQGVPYQERYFRWAAPWTAHVVYVCDYVRRLLEPRVGYPPAKASVVLNGIPLDPFLARPAAPGSAFPRVRFGTIGRLVPAKGHSVLIEAFSRAAARIPSAELVIYGYGSLERDLAAQIARLGLTGRVSLAGRTADPAAALQSLDVFVLSSVTEGLPLVILEAMAAGLPILATDVGGVAEIVPPGSWICPPDDPASLAGALIDAASSGDLAPRGGRARELARARHGVDAMAAEYERLYRRLLPA